jgi:hypothetical protein
MWPCLGSYIHPISVDFVATDLQVTTKTLQSPAVLIVNRYYLFSSDVPRRARPFPTCRRGASLPLRQPRPRRPPPTRPRG